MNPNLERILELARLKGGEKDPKFRALMRRLCVFPDQSLEAWLLRKLTMQAGDEAFDPPAFSTPRESDLAMPDTDGLPYVSFGRVASFSNGAVTPLFPFTFPLTSSHRGFFGRARSGKTVAVAQLIRSLPATTTVVIFDPTDDKVWLNLALLSPEFFIIPGLQLKRNLLGWPKGDDPQAWLNELRRNFAESFFLRDGSLSLLTVLFNLALEEHRQTGKPMTLRGLYNKLIEHRYKLIARGREESWFESLKNRLEFALATPMFNCTRGFDYAKLCSTNTLIPCKGVGPDEYALLVNDFLLWVGRAMPPGLSPVPRLLAVIDETHYLANWRRLQKAGSTEAVPLTAARTLAKSAVGIVVIDQVVSELPTTLLANLEFRAVFATTEGLDLDRLQRSLGLTPEQRVAISHLPRGACVVQYGNPNHPEPFVVVVDEFPLRADIEEEVQARVAQSLAALSYTPEQPNTEVRSSEMDTKREVVEPLLSPDAKEYLATIARNQFEAVSVRDRKGRIALAQGNGLRAELEAAGLITVVEVDTHGRSRKIKNTRITEKGYVLLKSMKISFERPKGKGGPEHQYHQYLVALWGRAHGYRAFVEYLHNGKSVDVCFEKAGERIAIEILCEGVKKELANIRDLEVGFAQLWFCVASPVEARRIQQLIEATFRDEASEILPRMQFKLLGEFQGREGVETNAESEGQQ